MHGSLRPLGRRAWDGRAYLCDKGSGGGWCCVVCVGWMCGRVKSIVGQGLNEAPKNRVKGGVVVQCVYVYAHVVAGWRARHTKKGMGMMGQTYVSKVQGK